MQMSIFISLCECFNCTQRK